jgi:hypothetical protein
MKKNKKLAIFDKAYNKAARMRPGDKNPLSEREFLVLLEAIRKCEARKKKNEGC